MNLANVFKPTGTRVQKVQKAAVVMVLKKCAAPKTKSAKKVDQAGSVAASLGLSR